jgi:hypothetical protein
MGRRVEGGGAGQGTTISALPLILGQARSTFWDWNAPFQKQKKRQNLLNTLGCLENVVNSQGLPIEQFLHKNALK